MKLHNRSITQHAHPDFEDAVAVTRFWRHVAVAPDADCWPWLGDVNRDGYGDFFCRGKDYGAHELAVSFSRGEKRLPTLDTCHTCDNPACCNPSHLRFDTRQSNVDDMFRRGRVRLGENSPNARLTDQQVREMRERRANGALQNELAEIYGVSRGYVSEVVNGLMRLSAGGPITGKSKRTTRSKHVNKKRAA